MAKNWLNEYDALRQFLKSHPDIKIDQKTVCVPAELRQEYFQLLDDIKASFIRQFWTGALTDSVVIAERFTAVCELVMKKIGLERITVTGEVDSFLASPVQYVTSAVTSNLTDLVKGLTDCDSFEADAGTAVNARLESSLGVAYEKYIVLAVINMLGTTEVLDVPLPKPTAHQLVKYSSVEKREPPRAARTTVLKLTDEQYPVLGVPDFIAAVSGQVEHLAFKSSFIRPHWFASEHQNEAEWYRINEIDSALSSDLLLVFTDDSADRLAMIADAELVRRPDMVIVCQARKAWINEEKIKKLNFQHNTLKPINGSFLVLKETAGDRILEGLDEGIRVLEVGFEQAKLEPIISVMSRVRT